MQYRREIDGLRAVAVVPVILFHAGFEIFSGGFVGVDVFFVISGYLITSIIINERTNNSFSLLKFYERRARRILPALFLVMLCTIPFAWLWLSPLQLENFAQSIVAVSVFLSNILFWRKSGYFDADAADMPLLHTWSLAVEEQYYLVFPIFILLMWRFGRQPLIYSIVLISIASLLLSEWGWRNEPLANFYLAPTRAWELLAGSLCAFFLYRRQLKPSNVLSLLGLTLVLFSVLAYDESTPFPSVFALAPVGGTALIILFGGSSTWTARILSLRPFVSIGLISYSAYLWHQPLFAFARVRSLGEPSDIVMTSLAAGSLILAFLSWRFVERPFRYAPSLRSTSPNRCLGISVIVASIFISVGLIGHLQDGFPTRKNSFGFSFTEAKFTEPNFGLSKDCTRDFTLSPKCRTGDTPEILVWGDSFAMHLIPALLESKKGIALVQMTNSGCAPLFGVAKFSPARNLSAGRATKCIEFNSSVLDWLRSSNSVKYVVVSSIFNYLDDSRYDLILANGTVRKSNLDFIEQRFVETLKTIEATGAVPVVVSPTPRSGKNLGKCLLGAMFLNRPLANCNFSRDQFSNDTVLSEMLLKRIRQSFHVVSMIDAICDADTCSASIGDTPLFSDEGHLSVEGSAALGLRINLYEQITRPAAGSS